MDFKEIGSLFCGICFVAAYSSYDIDLGSWRRDNFSLFLRLCCNVTYDFVSSVFNQKTLYNAYKKRTKNMEIDMEVYNKSKEEDPEFYRNASSLQYGKVI